MNSICPKPNWDELVFYNSFLQQSVDEVAKYKEMLEQLWHGVHKAKMMLSAANGDVKKYTEKRLETDTEFADEFEVGYANFKIGVMLRQAREAAGMTQEEVARQLNTTKSAISRIENHAEDTRLSTLNRYAKAVGANLQIRLARLKSSRAKLALVRLAPARLALVRSISTRLICLKLARCK